MQILIYGVLVFVVALLAGSVAIKSFQVNKNNLTFFMTFSGSYLFAITIVHILPEVFTATENVHYTGIFVLIGFFIQQILEFFSSGVEHGHIHEANSKHNHSSSFIFSVVMALFIHAFLEGTLLNDTHGEGIFLGILIHKAPAAFALVSVLLCHIKSKIMTFGILVVFSLASPLGMTISHVFSSESVHFFLFALVAGSFLQISTTIVFESSANHKFNLRKLMASITGMFLAIMSELFFL